MRKSFILFLAVAFSTARADTAPKAFHDTIKNTFSSKYTPRQIGEGAYSVIQGSITLEYSQKDQGISIIGEVGNGPVLPFVFDVAARFASAWCGIKYNSKNTDYFIDWYTLGNKRRIEQLNGQRDGYLVKARMGTCRIVALSGNVDTWILIKRVADGSVWPPKLID